MSNEKKYNDLSFLMFYYKDTDFVRICRIENDLDMLVMQLFQFSKSERNLKVRPFTQVWQETYSCYSEINQGWSLHRSGNSYGRHLFYDKT